jgi:2-oxoglutarate dehydrogenase E2 component (dihydrolipoamide succinyltransferase)
MKDIIIPSVAESITEVMIAEWLKADGDYVEMDEPICTIETDKASMDITAEFAGVLKTIVEEDDVVKVGAVIGSIDETASAPTGASAPVTATTTDIPATVANSDPAPNPSNSYASGHPSPAASIILDGKGIPASEVAGSGKDGRITKQDAQAAQHAPAASPASVEKKAPKMPEYPSDGVTRQKMSMLRRNLAKRLVSVKNETAMLTTFNEVDMSAVMDIRKKYKDAFKDKYEVNLGFMSFFTKACAIALKEFPLVNSQIEGNEIIVHHNANIGIAVSTDKGLVVPVVRASEKMSFAEIEGSILGYAKKARAGKISIQDMEGGTFTITNGGVFGSMLSTPIINPPQSAILGMHNIVKRPVVVGDEIKIRPIMYLALSYDHRVIDGKESVSFLKMVKDILEDPYRYFLGL